uniref:Ig-like domain-containing protein n=1 Tax=Gopherus agassizii TaxID=38772 RepID=A0A452IMK7_9SAUR
MSDLCSFILLHRDSPVWPMYTQFSVTGPDHPVTARIGEAIVLPYHLSPRMSTENMEVRWFRSQFSGVVHLYHDGQDQYREQMPDYHGRTELLKDGIMDGNVSLRILNICRSDEGQYSCFIQSHAFYGEALLELKIAGQQLLSVLSYYGLLLIFISVYFCLFFRGTGYRNW